MPTWQCRFDISEFPYSLAVRWCTKLDDVLPWIIEGLGVKPSVSKEVIEKVDEYLIGEELIPISLGPFYLWSVSRGFCVLIFVSRRKDMSCLKRSTPIPCSSGYEIWYIRKNALSLPRSAFRNASSRPDTVWKRIRAMQGSPQPWANWKLMS